MCGRFAITLPPDAMAQLFEAQPANDLPPVPNYNVCPTNRVHAVVSDDAAQARGDALGVPAALVQDALRRPAPDQRAR
jgi:putative SOS response-associated peptidase YedK